MLRRNTVGLLVCLAALTVASLGVAGVPDLTNSTATTAATAQVVLFNVPDGSGNDLTQAADMTQAPGTHAIMDGTISVTLLDAGMNPVYLFPFEDMWLETTAGGLAACANGTVADASTDINGQTTFTGPFYAGGSTDPSMELTQVMVNGAPIASPGSALDVQFNSPDYNGDGVVDGATDLVFFSTNYTDGNYHFDTDFYYDGVIDISDLVLFSAAFNASCP